jgi:hypothetical protein
MDMRLCDDRGPHGFSWCVEEPMQRTSHVLAADGKVWFVDPVDWPEGVDRACALGEPAGVLQLLDRHNRDCASLAARLGVEHHRLPVSLPESPFETVSLVSARRWREVALWWPAERTLVVPEAVGTSRAFTGGTAPAGVHLLLRLTPPRTALERFEPDHLLVGHGEGIHGEAATTALRDALAESRTGLPGVVLRLPRALRGGG